MAEAVKVNNSEEREAKAAPSRVSEAAAGAAERVTAYPRRMRQFLHDVRVELRQVTWPSSTDVRATTAVVIVTVFFFGAFLALVDTGVSRIVDQILQMFRR
jgi:preprotein translocase subunit SecE